MTCELALGPGRASLAWDGKHMGSWMISTGSLRTQGMMCTKSRIDLETQVETLLRNIGCPKSICDRGIWIWGGGHWLSKMWKWHVVGWSTNAQFPGLSLNPTGRCSMIMMANSFVPSFSTCPGGKFCEPFHCFGNMLLSNALSNYRFSSLRICLAIMIYNIIIYNIVSI